MCVYISACISACVSFVCMCVLVFMYVACVYTCLQGKEGNVLMMYSTHFIYGYMALVVCMCMYISACVCVCVYIHNCIYSC